jgi:hypothetical protein
MAREKVQEEVVEVVQEEVRADSDAKVAFRKLIEVYKVSNPAKYEAKKEALEAKLNSL